MMREAGLAIAMIVALIFGGRLMHKLDIWLRSGRIKDDDEETRERDQSK